MAGLRARHRRPAARSRCGRPSDAPRGGLHVYAGFDVLGPRRAAAPRPAQPAATERRATGARTGGPAPDAERAYLRQVARRTLLTREAEIDLGERIATGEREIARAALTSKPGVAHVLALADRLAAGEMRVRDLVRLDAEAPAAEQAASARLLKGLARGKKMAALRGRRVADEAMSEALLDLGLGSRPIDEVVQRMRQLAERERRLDGRGTPALVRALAVIDAAQQRVQAAKRVLIESNLRLVAAIARRYRNRGLDFSDLVQEGNLGRLRAADRFDRRRGYRFSTCAKWWIRKAITYAIADRARTIRIPVDVVAAIDKLKVVSRKLAHDLGREPDAVDLADRLRLPVERVERLLRMGAGIARDPISLEVPAGDEDERTLGDTLEDEGTCNPLDEVCARHMSRETRAALAHLDPRETLVLRLRFGIDAGSDHTLEEIGGHLSVTRERVRQIEAKALAKLRDSPAATALRACYDT